MFDGLVVGDLSKKEFRVGKHAKDKNDHIIYDKANHQLLFDSNGNEKGGEQAFAKVGDGVKITHDDFIVI